MRPPTFTDVVAARNFISNYLPKTPLIRVSAISENLGCDYYAKLENLQPVGAFKVRGGVNLVGTSDAKERERGLVTASTGNHGQGVAYAGKKLGISVTVIVPKGNNPDKNAAIKALGLAGLFKLRQELEGKTVCVILSGSNLDANTLRRVVNITSS